MELQKISGKIGHLDATNYYPFNISGSEVYGITCVLVVASVSAGISVLAPATVTLQHSWDKDTWHDVPSAALYAAAAPGVAVQISAAGTYILTPSANSGKLAPLCRVKIVIPAGQTIEVPHLTRTRLGTEESYGIAPAETIAVSVPAAQAYIQNSLIKVAYDTILPVFNATNDVYTYKTGGIAGTTVATLTVTYANASKDVTTSVVVS